MMVKINFLIKKVIPLLCCILFISHFAVAMFTVPRRKPVIGKSSTYFALKPVLEEEKEKARAINFLEDKEKAINLLMEKEIEAGYLKKFYIYNEKSEKGTFVDRDTLFLSITFSNLLGDTVNEAEGVIAPSKRLIPVSDIYSEETITNAFDLLKKYQEKQSILDDIATMDLKSFTELVNFCHYIDLSATDIYIILSNELLSRIKKGSVAFSRSDIQQLESVHPDFVKTFVIPKAVWDIKLMAVLKNYLEINATFPMEFDVNFFSVCDTWVNDNQRKDEKSNYYTWIFTNNNQWFLQFFYVPKDRAVYNIWMGPINWPRAFANINNYGGAVMQLQCNWEQKRAVAAIKGNRNNGIVLDCDNIDNLFGFALPECAQDINSIAISHDGNFVAASFDSENNNIIVWDITAGKNNIITTKDTREKPVFSVMFAKNTAGSDVLMYCSERTIYSKNTTTNQWEELASFDNPIQKAEMSPDGKAIAVLFDSSIILINAENGLNIYKTQKDAQNYSIVFSPDNTYINTVTSHQWISNYFFGDVKWINNTLFGGIIEKSRYGDRSYFRIMTPFNDAKELLPKDLTMTSLINIYNWFDKGIVSKSFDYFKYRGGQALEAFKGYFNALQ